MEPSYNFDGILERKSRHSTKWLKYPDETILPLWVADMDFKVAPEIQARLLEVVQYGIYGYTSHQEVLRATVVDYVLKQYAWHIHTTDLLWLPGLVPGINLACRALCQAHEAVISFTPVYPPFLKAPKLAGAQLIASELKLSDGKWRMDLTDLEAKLAVANSKPRLLLLCNPHNPVGRAWQRDELLQLWEFAKRHELWVCADEIHCDLILEPGRVHIPFASLNDDAKMRTITLMSPSKTFNLAGLNCAYAICANPELRRKVTQLTQGLIGDLNLMGLAACEAALTQGEAWRQALISYLRANRDLVCHTLNQLPGIKVIAPEATYLAWIDGREFANHHQITHLAKYLEQYGVGLSAGEDFAASGFVRLNFGAPRSLVATALERINQAILHHTA
jgi:cystathionine beta-lyase